MMKKNDTINKCFKFLIIKRKIIISKTFSIIIYNKVNDSCELSFDISGIEFIGMNKSMVYLKNSEGIGYGIDLLNNHLEKLIEDPKLLLYNDSSLNLIPIYKSGSIFAPRSNGIYDSVKNEVLFISEKCKSSKIIKNLYVGIDNDIIYNSNISNGNNIWQHPFSFPPYLDGFETKKTTQVEQFIGIYKNELWVLFSNNRFLVLDIATGEELYQIENLKNNLQLEGLATGDVFLDEENKKIKILAYLYYIEIDLDTRKAEIKKTYTDGFVIGKGQFYEGDKYVYFNGSKDISTKKSIGNNITGILNTETTEIEWYYKIDEDEKFAFFVDKPQANKKYFGVRDSNDTLHLFDRE